jgi:hypothetical protein
MAADPAFGIGMEAGDVLQAPVHGQRRARHRRLEAVGRFGIKAEGGKVEVLPEDDLPCAFEAEPVDRPFGPAQVGIEAAPVLRQRPCAAHVLQPGEMPAKFVEDQRQ